MSGTIIAIYIAPEASAPMQAISEARLEAGQGIVGDRYHAAIGTFSEELRQNGDFQVTLIEAEQVDQFNRTTGLALDYGAPRRNVVTRGIDLNSLVGKEFSVGSVRLQGIRLCEPCSHLAKMVAKEVLPHLVHRAGLRAKILESGTIRPKDSVG